MSLLLAIQNHATSWTTQFRSVDNFIQLYQTFQLQISSTQLGTKVPDSRGKTPWSKHAALKKKTEGIAVIFRKIDVDFLFVKLSLVLSIRSDSLSHIQDAGSGTLT